MHQPNTDFDNYSVGIFFENNGEFTMRTAAELWPDPAAANSGAWESVGWRVPLPPGCKHLLIDSGLILLERVPVSPGVDPVTLEPLPAVIPAEPAVINSRLRLVSGKREVFLYPYEIGLDQKRVCFNDSGFILPVDVLVGEEEFVVLFEFENVGLPVYAKVFAAGTWEKKL